MQAANKASDRRKKTRFPICREMRYKLVEGSTVISEGSGQTINIGSGGVRFTITDGFKAGTYVQLSISWPVLLEENTRMRLVVFGRLVHVNGRSAACTIDKYEFRTQARAEGAESVGRRDSMLQRWVEEVQKEMLRTRTATA